MKLKKALETLIEEFGTVKERKALDKVVEIFAALTGNRDVSDAVMAKVVKAGRQLKALGIS